MGEVYLISQDDIQKYHSISDIPQGRLNPFILTSQELDLKPVLNEALYHDFITKYNNSSDPMFNAYQNLLNGTNYTYSGVTIEYPGIIPMLVAFTMARFLPINQIQITRHSVVIKKNDQSDPVPSSTLTYIVNSLRSEATAYQNQLEKFLLQNQTSYPLYGQYPSTTQSRTGSKFINSARYIDNRYRGWWNGNYYE